MEQRSERNTRVTRKAIAIQARWLDGDRTPAWDALWDRILSENLLTSEGSLAFRSPNGQARSDGEEDGKPH